jgi:hypothetical protein
VTKNVYIRVRDSKTAFPVWRLGTRKTRIGNK